MNSEDQRGERLLISACLLGKPCRYDGQTRRSQAVEAEVARWREAGGEVVPVCPEQLGQFSTPRPPAELRGGDGHAVLDRAAGVYRVDDDEDLTEGFIAGAQAALKRGEGPSRAILKARSPSCGVAYTHIDGQVRPGDGVFAALLHRAGVPTQTDETLDHAGLALPNKPLSDPS